MKAIQIKQYSKDIKVDTNKIILIIDYKKKLFRYIK